MGERVCVCACVSELDRTNTTGRYVIPGTVKDLEGGALIALHFSIIYFFSLPLSLRAGYVQGNEAKNASLLSAFALFYDRKAADRRPF